MFTKLTLELPVSVKAEEIFPFSATVVPADMPLVPGETLESGKGNAQLIFQLPETVKSEQILPLQICITSASTPMEKPRVIKPGEAPPVEVIPPKAAEKTGPSN